MEVEVVAKNIVDAAYQVHRVLGPGLLESAYQHCHIHELRKRGMKVQSELPLPILYDGVRIDAGYRLDMVVEECVVVENKTVESLLPIHEAQLLTYLKLGGYQLGFLINWNVKLIKYGIKRIALNLPEPLWQEQHRGKVIR